MDKKTKNAHGKYMEKKKNQYHIRLYSIFYANLNQAR